MMHGEVAQAQGNKHGFVHMSTYEPSRALPMKKILKRPLVSFCRCLLGHDNKLAEGGNRKVQSFSLEKVPQRKAKKPGHGT